MAFDERTHMGRRATLGLAALLAATVMTGAAGIAGLVHGAAPLPATPATPATAAVPPGAENPAPAAVASHHEWDEED